jgi:hypothetical protein
MGDRGSIDEGADHPYFGVRNQNPLTTIVRLAVRAQYREAIAGADRAAQRRCSKATKPNW